MTEDKPEVVGSRKVKPKCKPHPALSTKCQDYADCEGCPVNEECAEADRIEGADE